ncbi:MAG: trypsin-like serine protease [Oligoflexia bacterium]|nr:trypsin-like serine protease [Oligoflexia bacterium]
MKFLSLLLLGFFAVAPASLLATEQLAPIGSESDFIELTLAQDVILNGNLVTGNQSSIQKATAKIISVNPYNSLDMSLCSGTLIASDVILTAAHCFLKRAPGRVSFSSDDNIDSIVSENIADFVVHPNFKLKKAKSLLGIKLNDMDTENDIALVFLKEKLPAFLTPALLPPKGYSIHSSPLIILAGFGKVSQSDSVSIFKKPLNFTLAKISDAGNSKIKITGKKNICSGDSGGPIYGKVERSSKLVVLGVHSFGNCSDSAQDTKVSDYTNWILLEIEKFRSTQDI